MLYGARLKVLGNIQMGVVQVRILVDRHVDTRQVGILYELPEISIGKDQACTENVVCLLKIQLRLDEDNTTLDV